MPDEAQEFFTNEELREKLAEALGPIFDKAGPVKLYGVIIGANDVGKFIISRNVSTIDRAGIAEYLRRSATVDMIRELDSARRGEQVVPSPETKKVMEHLNEEFQKEIDEAKEGSDGTT